MKLVFLIAWRSWTSRPGRAIASTLGVAVGIATVLAVSTVDHNTILSQLMRRGERIGDPDVELRPLEPDPARVLSLPAVIADDPAIESVTALFLDEGRLTPIGQAGPGVPVRVCGFRAGTSSLFDAYEIEAGQDLSDDEEPGIVVSRELAARLALAPGASVSFEAVAPSIEGCLDGRRVTIEPEGQPRGHAELRVVGVMAERNLGRRADQVVIPFTLGVRLFRGLHLQPIFWGRLRPGAIYQDARVRLKDRFVVDKPKRALVGERVDQRAFRKGIRLSSYLSLLLGLFVIYNAFSMSLVERIKEIGFLRALGMSSREIRAAFLLEGGLVALGGVVVGLLLAAAIVQGMRFVGITSLGYGKPLVIHEIPWGQVALVSALGFGIALVGVAAPLLRAAELSVVEALRTGQAAFGERPRRAVRVLGLVALIAAIPAGYMLVTPPLGERQGEILRLVLLASLLLALFLGSLALAPRLLTVALGWLMSPFAGQARLPVLLARSATAQSRHRIQASVTGLMLVFTGILVIQGVTRSLKDETERFVDRAVAGRLFVRTGKIAASRLDPLASLPGLEGIVSLSAEIRVPFILRGVPPEVLRTPSGEPVLTGKARETFVRGDGLILSSHLAASYGYEVGEMVRLSAFGGPKLAEVVAVDDRFGFFPDDRAWAVMALDAFRNLYCIDGSEGDRYVAPITPGQDRQVLPQRVRAAVPGVPLQFVDTDDAIRTIYTRDRDLDFLIFDVILGLTAFLAAVGMLNSLTIAVLERRREISLLHAVGLGQREIAGMLLLETGAVGMAGGVLALALGGALSCMAVTGLRTISQLDVRWAFGPGNVLLAVGGALSVSLLASLYPIWRTRHYECCDWE